MRHIAMTSLLVFLLIIDSAASALAQSAGGGSAPPGEVGPVFIESSEIILLESFPVQAALVVRGELPTPCHELAWEIQDFGDSLDVRLWSLADPDAMCAQVLEPFDVTLPLGSFESADLDVVVNGGGVGRIEIGTPASIDPPALVGAGWSFGMCAGYCEADLVVTGDEVLATGHGNLAEGQLYANRGSLTPEGRRRIESALSDLAGVALEPVYGCPDCADGGAAYVALEREGVTSRHAMDFSAPPEELAALHELSLAIIDDLQTCGSSDLVTVAGDCEAYEGR